MILINNQWRAIQTYRILIIGIMKNEHMSPPSTSKETRDEYEEEGWICNCQKHDQTIRYLIIKIPE